MSTRNFVPRANNEGSIGTAARRWGAVHTGELHADVYHGLPNFRRGGTAYVVGDVIYSAQLPSHLRLECVVAGVTAAVEPSFTGGCRG